MTSPFAQVAAQLIERDYSALPIIPGEKRPGHIDPVSGEVIGLTNSRSEYTSRLATEHEVARWNATDSGVCVVTGPASQNVVAIDLDTDRQDIKAALLKILPTTTLVKRGAKGETRFFRGTNIKPEVEGGTLSPSWNLNTDDDKRRERIVDFIGPGRQTVLPPTIHPNTGKPYLWLAGDSLENTDSADIPELPSDIFAKISEALKPFGITRTAEYAPIGAAAYNDNPDLPDGRRLNNRAFADLERWVPDLVEGGNLYGLRRNRGGYEAVALWRESNEGRPTAKRKRNLKISYRGAVDFGDGPRSFTAINLVCAAFDIDPEEPGDAFKWLKDRIGEPDEWPDCEVNRPSAQAATDKSPTREVYMFMRKDGKIFMDVTTINDAAIYDHLKSIGGTKTEAVGNGLTFHTTIHDPNARDTLDGLTQNVPGLVGEITEWILSISRRPNRPLAFGAALTLVGTLIGRRDVGPTNSSNQLYVLGLAPTGAGKDDPLKAITRLLVAAELHHLIGPGQFMSQTSIIDQVKVDPLCVCPMDEFGRFMKRINAKKAMGHEMQIVSQLSTLWSCKHDVYLPPRWANCPTQFEPLYAPAVSIFGVSTPEEFFESIGSGNLPNGFLNRFTVIMAKKVPETKPQRDRNDIPENIITGMKALYQIGRYGATNYEGKNPEVVPHGWTSNGAEEIYQAFRQEIEARIDSDPTLEHYIERCPEQALRIAQIIAAGRRGEGLTVGADDISRAVAFVRLCGNALAKEAGHSMTEEINTFGQAQGKVVAVLRKVGLITRAELWGNRVKGVDPSIRKKVIEDLDRNGKIRVETSGSAEAYKWIAE